MRKNERTTFLLEITSQQKKNRRLSKTGKKNSQTDKKSIPLTLSEKQLTKFPWFTVYKKKVHQGCPSFRLGWGMKGI